MREHLKPLINNNNLIASFNSKQTATMDNYFKLHEMMRTRPSVRLLIVISSKTFHHHAISRHY